MRWMLFACCSHLEEGDRGDEIHHGLRPGNKRAAAVAGVVAWTVGNGRGTPYPIDTTAVGHMSSMWGRAVLKTTFVHSTTAVRVYSYVCAPVDWKHPSQRISVNVHLVGFPKTRTVQEYNADYEQCWHAVTSDSLFGTHSRYLVARDGYKYFTAFTHAWFIA